MRRVIALTLFLACASLFLAACSEVTNPTAPVTDESQKTAMTSEGLPVGYDPFFADLAKAIRHTEWIEIPVTLDLAGGSVVVHPAGYSPIELIVDAEPNGGAPVEWPCFLYLPAAPLDGRLVSYPGGCLVFRTAGFPPASYGRTLVKLPIMEFNDTPASASTFTAYNLGVNSYGFTDAFDSRAVGLADGPVDPDEPAVYVDVTGVVDKTGTAETNETVVEPAEGGDEE